MVWSSSISARVLLILLAVTDAVAIVGLHRLGDRAWASVDFSMVETWTSASPEVVVTALLRIAALGAGYWIAISLVVAIATTKWSIRTGHWTTLPFVRRLVEKALAVSFVTSTALSPAVASATELPPIPIIVEAPAAGTEVDGTAVTPPANEFDLPEPAQQKPALEDAPKGILVPPLQDPPVPSSSAQRSTATATEHTVQPGDSMWVIAQRHLASIGAPTSDPDVASYWVEVIEANRGTIRSGDPDLIYPGEVLTLPEAPA